MRRAARARSRARRTPRARRRDSSSGRSGTISPLMPRCAELGGEALGPAREERVGVTHEHDREQLGDPLRRPRARRAAFAPAASALVAAAWITGPSASGSLNGHAELDQVGPGLRVRGRDGHRGLDVREAGHQVRHQRRAARARPRRPRRSCRFRSPSCAAGDAASGLVPLLGVMSAPSLSSASARSLSPRPDRQIRSTVSAPASAAPAPSTQATAWADSSAGMIPSSSASRWNAPSACVVGDRDVARAPACRAGRRARGRCPGSRGRREIECASRIWPSSSCMIAR